jgi:hypothetical protein
MSTNLFDDASNYKAKPRCHTTHKPIKLGMGEILGASCGSPKSGYDIYIGFDYGMKFSHQPYPWEQKSDPVIEFQYHITDMCAPKDAARFRKMIEWTAEQLELGKKIHVGCIGGHGRTGTFLAALVSLYKDLTDDPIKWVRENHCVKAVESESQIKFLVNNFGCKTATPTKESFKSSSGSHTYTNDWKDKWRGLDSGTVVGRTRPHGSVITEFPKVTRNAASKEKLRAMTGKGSIWG